MVLPILIGVGVTMFALTSQTALRAWQVYRTLSPHTIARLNGVILPKVEPSSKGPDMRFASSRLDSQLQQRLESYYGSFRPRMNETEALLILNISTQEISKLDTDMLKRKHRAALLQNHPDKGGSPYLSMKINEARDLLAKSVLVRK